MTNPFRGIEPGQGNVGPALHDDKMEELNIIHIFSGPSHKPATCPFCKPKELPE